MWWRRPRAAGTEYRPDPGHTMGEKIDPMAEIILRYPDRSWELERKGGGPEYEITRVAPTDDGAIVIWFNEVEAQSEAAQPVAWRWTYGTDPTKWWKSDDRPSSTAIEVQHIRHIQPLFTHPVGGGTVEGLKKALEGHPDSELWGENGLVAATMRDVRRLRRIDDADLPTLLRENLPGSLSIEPDDAEWFWEEYARAVRTALNRLSADPPGGESQ